MLGKLLHIEEIFDSKCIKQSSVPAMGAYSVPRPSSWIEGTASQQKKDREGRVEKGRDKRGRRDHPPTTNSWICHCPSDSYGVSFKDSVRYGGRCPEREKRCRSNRPVCAA